MIRFVLSVGLLLSTTLVANTQQLGPREVRVQVSINFSTQVTSTESEDVLKAQENARRLLYLAADKECVVLRETIATECKLENISVNINRSRHSQQDTLNAGASMTFRVQLK